MRKLFMLFGLMAVFAMPAAAQGVSEATGKVADREGNPIQGATVTFWSKSNPDTKYHDTTSKKGRYFVPGLFTSVAEERWFMTLEVEGFIPVEVRVESRNVNRVLVGDIMTAKLGPGRKAPDIVIRPLGKVTVDWTVGPAEEVEAEFLAAAQAVAVAEGATGEGDEAAPPKKDPWVEALTLASAGSLEESVEFFEEAVTDEPDDPERHETFAKILYRLERYDQAEGEALRAVEIDAGRVESQMVLFNVYDARDDLGQAKIILEKAQLASPNDTRILMRLAYVAGRQGDVEGAIVAYTRVTEVNPDSAEAWLALANLHAEAGNLEASEAAYAKVVEINPDGAHQTYYNLGATIIKRGARTEEDTRRAVEAFRKALEIQPDYGRAAQELAIALIGLGDRDGARTTLESFVASNPDSPDTPRMQALIRSLGG